MKNIILLLLISLVVIGCKNYELPESGFCEINGTKTAIPLYCLNGSMVYADVAKGNYRSLYFEVRAPCTCYPEKINQGENNGTK